jgi:hypothetical protein
MVGKVFEDIPLEKCLTVGRGFVKITSKWKIFNIHINRWALGKNCWFGGKGGER